MPAVLLSTYSGNLAAAGSAATTAGTVSGTVLIDYDATLAAATVLEPKATWIASGGIITCGAYAITGNFAGPPDIQIFNETDTGAVYMPDTTEIYGPWFFGTYGDSGKDYGPGLQRAVNLIARNYNAENYESIEYGPRVLHLEGVGSGNPSKFRGIFLTAPIQFPPAAYGFTIFHQGQDWVQKNPDTPFFIFDTGGKFESTQNDSPRWEFIGNQNSNFNWYDGETPPTIDAVVFQMTASGTETNGMGAIRIQGATVASGWGFIATSGSGGFNGWFDCDILDIFVGAIAGSFAYHHPTGGSERQYYRNIFIGFPNHGHATVPLFDIAGVGGLELDQVSIDGVGLLNLDPEHPVDSPMTYPLILLSNCASFELRNLHFESLYTNYSAPIGLISVIESCNGIISGVQTQTWLADGSYISVLGLTNSSSTVSIDNVRASETTLAMGAGYPTMISVLTSGAKAIVGQNIILDDVWLSAVDPFSTSHPEYASLIGSQDVMFYGTNVTAGATTLTVGGTSISGYLTLQNSWIGLAGYSLSTPLTGSGGLAVSFYDGATFLFSITLDNTSPQTGIFLGGKVYTSNPAAGDSKLTSLNKLTVNATPSGGIGPGSVNLQVVVTYLLRAA